MELPADPGTKSPQEHQCRSKKRCREDAASASACQHGRHGPHGNAVGAKNVEDAVFVSMDADALSAKSVEEAISVSMDADAIGARNVE